MISSDQYARLADILERDPAELREWEGQSFRNDLGLDSLELFELVLRIEIAFEVLLPEDLLAQIDSLDDVMACLQNIERNYASES